MDIRSVRRESGITLTAFVRNKFFLLRCSLISLVNLLILLSSGSELQKFYSSPRFIHLIICRFVAFVDLCLSSNSINDHHSGSGPQKNC